MSGPVRTVDVADDPAAPKPHVVELTPGREAVVGETTVRRSLPTRRRRTVGAWCFLDHAPEVLVDDGRGMQIGPHPHIGLQTVTWLLDGEVVHRDSLGSEQAIRPGQLNVMSAGNGVAHAEETPRVVPRRVARSPAVDRSARCDAPRAAGVRAPRRASRDSSSRPPRRR